MIKLQLALDFRNLQDARKVADKAEKYVDIIEAGTPLIKSEGLRAVEILKERFPDKLIVADMKTMDTGFFEAEIAYEAGADIVSVLGAADRETIKGVCDAARKHGKMMIVDTIGVDDMNVIAEKIKGLPVDFIGVHAGIDQQNAGLSPFSILERASRIDTSAKLAIAGGINAESAKNLKGYDKLSIVMVGGAITKSGNPEKAAKEIRSVLDAIR